MTLSKTITHLLLVTACIINSQSFSMHSKLVPGEIEMLYSSFAVTYRRLVPPENKDVELAQFNRVKERYEGYIRKNGAAEVEPLLFPQVEFDRLAQLYEQQEKVRLHPH